MRRRWYIAEHAPHSWLMTVSPTFNRSWRYSTTPNSDSCAIINGLPLSFFEPCVGPVDCEADSVAAQVETCEVAAHEDIGFAASRGMGADACVRHIFSVGPARCRVDVEAGRSELHGISFQITAINLQRSRVWTTW